MKYKVFENKHRKPNRELLKIRDWYNQEKERLEKSKDFKKSYIKSLQNINTKVREENKIIKKYGDKLPYLFPGDENSNFIYHYTDIISFESIINSGEMYGDISNSVSFSSEPNLYKYKFIFSHPNNNGYFGRTHKNIDVKIKLDFNKMKENGVKYKLGDDNKGTHYGEQEIMIHSKYLTNIEIYIKEVILFKEKSENLGLLYGVTDILKEKNIKYRVI